MKNKKDLIISIVIAIVTIAFVTWKVIDEPVVIPVKIAEQTEQGKANYEADLQKIKDLMDRPNIISMDRISEMFEPKLNISPDKTQITEEEFDYVCRCVEAEAGNQGITGKRYVISVILNRINSKEYENTVQDVINSPFQFAVVSTGAIEKVIVSEETICAVNMELEEQINETILYFQTGNYRTDRPEAFQYKDHYFSY